MRGRGLTFARDKRLLLCWLALLAPLPLPLNEPRPEGVVGWPFLLLYLAAVALCIHRADRGEERWLGPMALNLLGLAYLPFLVFDLAALDDGNLVQPMMHLVLFALVAKLYSIARERDKWHAVVGIFFVFVSSMATSASAGIVFYLIAFLGLAIWVLARFAQLHLLSLELSSSQARTPLPDSDTLPSEAPPTAPLPTQRRVIAGLIGATLFLSVPLFFFLPRLGSPYLTASAGGRALGFATGFSDEVNLDIASLVRGNRQVALRLELDGSAPAELRFRGAVFEHYQRSRWRRGRTEWLLRPRGSETRFPLAEGRVAREAQIFLEPLRSRALILPVEALTVEFERPPGFLRRNRGGSVRFPGPPASTLSYRVELAAAPVDLGAPPRDAGPDERDGTLEQVGISPQIAELAATVAGEGPDLERARRIEQHLATGYEYTLDFVGRPQGQPIDDFLFKYRSGHCEYFASAMVLMLRSVGIPARFVTGFLGGEYNPLGYYIVRQGNAHAWVEAYDPNRGWVIFDPTPPVGRPVIEPRSVLSLLRQGYDFVLFGWDRYVLSYGLSDQAELLGRLRAWIASLFSGSSESPEIDPATTDIEATVPEVAPVSGADGWRWLWLAAFLPFAALAWLWWRRPPRSATSAYLRLRRLAAARGVTVDDSTPPRVLEHRLIQHFPQSSQWAGRVVDLYLRESYRQEQLSSSQRNEAEQLVDQARQSLRRAS